MRDNPYKDLPPLERRPDGVIVQLGCGLETAYFRCDNGRSHWYAVDLPHVVEYRRALLSEPERETYLAGDAFAEDWIRQIRAGVPDAPILVTAGGLFHYFEESKVVGLLRMLTGFGEIEIVFDTVSKSGMAMMRKKYMKQVGHRDAQMFFYVDSASELTGKIGSGVRVLAEEPYLLPYPPKRPEAVHKDQHGGFGPVLDGQDGPSGNRMMPSPKAVRSVPVGFF